MKYAWVIDKGLTRDDDEPGATWEEDNPSAAPIYGPQGADDALLKALRDGLGTPFRVSDRTQDNTMRLEGRVVVMEPRDTGSCRDVDPNHDEEDAVFAPLDEYGRASWGCTDIEYRLGGKWTVI